MGFMTRDSRGGDNPYGRMRVDVGYRYMEEDGKTYYLQLNRSELSRMKGECTYDTTYGCGVVDIGSGQGGNSTRRRESEHSYINIRGGSDSQRRRMASVRSCRDYCGLLRTTCDNLCGPMRYGIV